MVHMSRRRLGVMIMVGAWGWAGCAGERTGTEAAQSASASSSGGASHAPGASDAASTGDSGSPSARPVADIPLVPDAAPRGVTPVSPEGEATEVEGLTLILPAGSSVQAIDNSAGNPATEIQMPSAEGGIPRVRVRRVESYGRALVEETYAQESLLVAEASTAVLRTREEWPGAAEGYLITWDTEVAMQDGSQLPLSSLGFWLDDGKGGGWTLIATAKRGQLEEGSELWNTVFSAKLP